VNDAFTKFIGVLTAIVGLAIVAVVLAQNSQSSNVIQSFFSGFGNILGVAVSPVTGGSVTTNLSYPTSSSMSGVANTASSFLGGGSGSSLGSGFVDNGTF
jgi:hypothetical protein